MRKEIPGYLYGPDSSGFKVAWMYIVDGVDDVKTIGEKLGVADKTVRNVKAEVNGIVRDFLKSKGIKEDDQRDRDDVRDNVRDDARDGTGDGTRDQGRDQGRAKVPIADGVLQASDITPDILKPSRVPRCVPSRVPRCVPTNVPTIVPTVPTCNPRQSRD